MTTTTYSAPPCSAHQSSGSTYNGHAPVGTNRQGEGQLRSRHHGPSNVCSRQTNEAGWGGEWTLEFTASALGKHEEAVSPTPETWVEGCWGWGDRAHPLKLLALSCLADLPALPVLRFVVSARTMASVARRLCRIEPVVGPTCHHSQSLIDRRRWGQCGSRTCPQMQWTAAWKIVFITCPRS